MRHAWLIGLYVLAVAGMQTRAMQDSDIPTEAFEDAVMAGADEINQMQAWVTGAFTAAGPKHEMLAAEIPFSFICDGNSSADLFKIWKPSAELRDLPDRIEHHMRWDDPATGLRVLVVAGAFKRFPAVDWVVYLENRGTKDTPIIENIQALDTVFTGATAVTTVLHQLNGDNAAETTFLPKTSLIEPNKPLRLAPNGGRPACTSAFPFFNFQSGERGAIIAVGWTGQWAATFERSNDGSTRIRAGVEKTRLYLRPGEHIRTPRILMMTWKGDLTAAHNRFRRLMLFHYFPRMDGRPLRLPLALQTYDRYNQRADWFNEAGQIKSARFAHSIGLDTLWFDAAWFPGSFPDGVGNWFCKPDALPNGLKPVSDVCHELGLRFMLWFEPERVGLKTQIAQEHMDFVFKGEHNHLYRLNDAKARRWLTDLLLQRIREYGIDIYRNDFNTEPLHAWRKYEEPNREGMNEILYVMGLYEMWDELRAKNPKLVIDNCSSGGRRIDLEMCMRSVPLWRSDTGCSAGHIDWNQAQSAALNQYLPLHTVGCWSPDPYESRSAGTAGLICEWGYLEPEFPVETAKAAVEEAKENQKYWYGDFYPLTLVGTSPGEIVAWQMHRPDLDAGLVLVFRRAQCSTDTLRVKLGGIKRSSRYVIDSIADSREKTRQLLAGMQLSDGFRLTIDHAPGSLILRYALNK